MADDATNEPGEAQEPADSVSFDELISGTTPQQPLTRRQLRALRERRLSEERPMSAPVAEEGSSTQDVSDAMPVEDAAEPGAAELDVVSVLDELPLSPEPPKKRRWLRVLLGVIISVAIVAGLAVAAFFLFKDDLLKLVGMGEPDEYPGPGTGQVVVVVDSGDYGDVIAGKLAEADVVKSSQSFYRYLLGLAESPTFQPGSYQLRTQMTNAGALEALLDPANKVETSVTIPEGYSADQVVAKLVAAGFDGDELAQLRTEPSSFGLPEQAKDLEGYLFPATYSFDPGTTARQALQQMVDRTMQSLEKLGIAPESSFDTVILASIVQRESGPDLDDMPKIARVFQNRLDIGMLLQSDATVAYGTGNTDTVWTTADERADTSNPYNTYAHKGLPVGPISNPGDDALAAAVHPADGDWIYFMVVNLSTGETVFSVDQAGHDRAVQQLAEWCNATAENRARCDQ